jgi:hypothetical protein
MASRARIVLLAAEAAPNHQIAEKVGVSRPTVNKWRSRYAERGLDGLSDDPRPGPARTVDQRRIITDTLTPPPRSLGVTHWSSRLLAHRLGVSHVTIAEAWKQFGVKPWKADTFKFSTDPELEAKVTDVVGLYLAPPENAIVLCVEVLDVELTVGDPGLVHGRRYRRTQAMRSEHGIGRGGRRPRRRLTQQVQHDVEQVHAEVHQRPAAGGGLSGEPAAQGRNPLPAYPSGLDVVDRSQPPRVDGLSPSGHRSTGWGLASSSPGPRRTLRPGRSRRTLRTGRTSGTGRT